MKLNENIERVREIFKKVVEDNRLNQFDFVVVAPPRSGTAWISNFLSSPVSTCLHEAIPSMASRKGLFEGFVEKTKEQFPDLKIGNADCTYSMFPELIPEDIPVVMIRRSFQSVHDSAVKIKFPVSGLKTIYSGLSELEKSGRITQAVDFDALFKRGDDAAVEAGQLMWNAIFPSIDFPLAHFARANQLHVNNKISLTG